MGNKGRHTLTHHSASMIDCKVVSTEETHPLRAAELPRADLGPRLPEDGDHGAHLRVRVVLAQTLHQTCQQCLTMVVCVCLNSC